MLKNKTAFSKVMEIPLTINELKSQNDFIEYLKKNSSSSLSKSDLKAIEAIEKSLSGSSSINTYDLLYISDKDLKHFDDTYRNCLTTLISKDCYSSEKDVKVEVDGDDEKTTAYYLTLTGADAYKFVEDFTNLAKNDSVLISIITEKANMVLESAGQSKIDEDTVKDALANLSDNLLEELESIKDEKVRLRFAEGYLPGWEVEEKGVCVKEIELEDVLDSKIIYKYIKREGIKLESPYIEEKNISKEELKSMYDMYKKGNL